MGTETVSVRNMTPADLILTRQGDKIVISLTNALGGVNVRDAVMEKLFIELSKPSILITLKNLFNNS